MSRYLIAFFVLAGLASPAFAAPDPADFAREVAALVRKAEPETVVTTDPADPLLLRIKPKGSAADEEPLQAYLNRIYQFCLRSPREECQAEKAGFVRTLIKPLPKAELRALRIIVRDAEYAAALGKMRAADGGKVAFTRQIGDDLFMLLAVDTPEAIAMVNAGTLAVLGLTEDQAWDLADVQTRAIVPRLPAAAALREKWLGYEGDSYLTSMAIDLEGWREIAAEVGPDLFITLATDRLIVFGILPDGPQLDKLAAAVRADCAEASRCISPNIYRFRDGKWVIAKVSLPGRDTVSNRRPNQRN